MGCSTSVPATASTHTTTLVHAPRHVVQLPRVVVNSRPIGIQLQQPLVTVQQPPVQIQQQQIYVGASPSISKASIEQFLFLSREIARLETKNIMSSYERLLTKKSDLEKELHSLHEQLNQKKMMTQKERQDVDKLKSLQSQDMIQQFFTSEASFEEQMSKEQEEYLIAIADQEMVEKQLQQHEDQLKNTTRQIDELGKDKEHLMSCYNQQDAVLEQAFGGTYGSALEDELERNLDKIIKRQHVIRNTMNNWRNAVNHSAAAAQQLQYAAQRWRTNIMTTTSLPKHDFQWMRVNVIGDIRNYLLAASRNLTSAQYCLRGTRLPYCDVNELNQLNRAIAYIYVDGLNKERSREAGNFYFSTSQHSAALRDWIRKVIEERIVTDLSVADEECRKARNSLRTERLTLMLALAKEKGIEVDIDTSAVLTEESVKEDSVDDVGVVEVEATGDTKELEKKLEEASAQNAEEDGEVEKAEEKPSLDELAPAPSKNELFGNLDSILAAYDEQKRTVAEGQDAERARQQAQLQEKLQQRRSRAARLEAQQL